ncbi:hypothetical protein A2483_00460 [Candidatus Peregrinibacteria bacterium RIFOXYC2_FULL_33_13]|nr:MAG: Sigma factor sigB regulation protein rsbU [Candidatus Peregrinibacteria bacterium GW2011_GWA2_33_10]KKP38351.1 MAG: sigma factor sigB regulation protein sigma-B regulation protein RsbU (phosphoserine phosphatase) [Candidatus Peregrinibacteria bacterium GW2011_GWC2_33_13]OGJ48833.1 MAG: hypothetical protein A2229_05545 [Candidatus Peregrinibacteria bacterium RIFOXYA2_FULL_33_7]OGJ52159.1 MAG: hypothetical protein A2483_00460 [Candidatus Peregrinibacteria bacterium RIFOXYC2_FULL_33_13]
MFKIFKTTLLAKFALIIIIITGAFTIGYYLAYDSNLLKTFPPLYFTAILIIFALLNFLLIYEYISKPFKVVLLEIKALLTGRKYKKIYTERFDEIGIIAHFFNQMTKSLEKASSDIKDRRRLSAELDIASKIQKETLPKNVPDTTDLTIIAKSKPAGEIGGDCFDFAHNKDNFYFFISDVTGHGIASGLIMMMGHTLIMTFAKMFSTGYEVLFQTNKFLKPLMSSIMFITLTLVRWNQTDKKLYATGAGHEHIIVYQTKNKKCFVEKSGGIALGMIEDNSKIIKEREIPFEKGDLLVLFTDGITESKNIYGELFGLQRLLDIIEENAEQKQTEEIFDIITEKLQNFTENHIQEDDMTIILCRYNKENSISPEINTIQWKI